MIAAMVSHIPLDLDHLNPSQRAAVTHPPGPLLVVAGPGSGKTRVVTHRIAWLIQERDVAPWRILAVTFTNRAAKEMRNRLESLIGADAADDVWMGTFHRICVRMLRAHGESIGVPRNFAIFDRDDQIQVVRRALIDLYLDPKEYPPGAIINRISRAKSRGESRDSYHAETYFDEIAGRVWERYDAALKDAASLDFDDLLLRACDLFTLPAARPARERYQQQFDYLFVDEFQDTSRVQYQLAKLWSGGGRASVTLVGDPDQSIYAWRSADVGNLRSFVQDYPGAAEVQLNDNYRSTQQILDAANAVISRSRDRMERQLRTDNPDGPLPRLHEAYSETDEAVYIADLIAQRALDGVMRPGDAAVLYRTNAQSRPIEEALVRHGIPYRLVGATRFYERREVRDLIAYLRLVRNGADRNAFERIVNVPPRGVGAKTLQALTDWAELHARAPMQAAAAAAGREAEDVGAFEPPRVSRRAGGSLRTFVALIEDARGQAAREPLADVLREMVQRIGYFDFLRRQAADEEEADERWQNVQELITVAASYSDVAPGAALDQFLEDVALVSDVDDLPDGPPDAVTLITLHQAKGLEFPCVFIVGLEEGILPHERSIDDPESREEERRLLYVGITRAERELYLLHTFRRMWQGRSAHNEPTRFLRDIPDELLDRGVSAAAAVSDDVRPARNRWASWDEFDDGPGDAEPMQINLRQGDRVAHEDFGEGVVLNVRQSGGDAEIMIRFAEAGTKRLLASMTNLTSVDF